MLPDEPEIATSEESEWFEYPTSWEEAYNDLRFIHPILTQATGSPRARFPLHPP